MSHADQKIRYTLGELIVTVALLEQQVLELQSQLAAARAESFHETAPQPSDPQAGAMRP